MSQTICFKALWNLQHRETWHSTWKKIDEFCIILWKLPRQYVADYKNYGSKIQVTQKSEWVALWSWKKIFILLMEEILHQLIGRLSHCLWVFYTSQVVQDFFHQQYHGYLRVATHTQEIRHGILAIKSPFSPPIRPYFLGGGGIRG